MHDLRTRGVQQIDLVVTNGHDDLLATLSVPCATTPRQRCLVHIPRTVMRSIPTSEQQEVQTDVIGIWTQETKAEALLTLAAFQASSPGYSHLWFLPDSNPMDNEAHIVRF